MQKQQLIDASFGTTVRYDGDEYTKVKTRKDRYGTEQGIVMYERKSRDEYYFKFFGNDGVDITLSDNQSVGVMAGTLTDYSEITDGGSHEIDANTWLQEHYL